LAAVRIADELFLTDIGAVIALTAITTAADLVSTPRFT
jgi:hypothetical protein